MFGVGDFKKMKYLPPQFFKNQYGIFLIAR